MKYIVVISKGTTLDSYFVRFCQKFSMSTRRQEQSFKVICGNVRYMQKDGTKQTHSDGCGFSTKNEAVKVFKKFYPKDKYYLFEHD